MTTSGSIRFAFRSTRHERRKSGPAARLRIQARHGLDVVVEDVRAARRSRARAASPGRESPASAPRRRIRARGGGWRGSSPRRSRRRRRGGRRGRRRSRRSAAAPSASTACATRSGSARSTRSGTPDFTLQKPQRRVHTSPRIMNVAVPRSQHSPMLGQFASSQTVCSDFVRISALDAPVARPARRLHLQPRRLARAERQHVARRAAPRRPGWRASASRAGAGSLIAASARRRGSRSSFRDRAARP